jgi:flagellar biosynthesis/type III secretory pathway chaperone
MKPSAKASDDRNTGAAKLTQLLAIQYRLAIDLQDIVNAIATTVTQSDYEQLDRLLAAKADVLNRLDLHNTDLQSWLLARGFKENALSEAISSLPDNRELLALWQDFKITVNDCQLKNCANGSIVRGRLKHTEQTLNLLTGRAIDAKPAYTAQGKCDQEALSRRLAKA